jgi:hypothetical protein
VSKQPPDLARRQARQQGLDLGEVLAVDHHLHQLAARHVLVMHHILHQPMPQQLLDVVGGHVFLAVGRARQPA